MTDESEDMEFEPVAEFLGYLTKWTGETTTNNLVLSIAAHGTQAKLDALPLTDIPGTMLRVSVEKRVYPTPEPES